MTRSAAPFRCLLLRPPRLEWRGQAFALPRRQARALIYRLAAQLEPVTRDQLCFLFWPDEPDAVARRHLTRLLSGLRAALPYPDLLLVTEETVALDARLTWSDSQAFAAGIEAGETATLTQALTLYRGPFMTGFALPNAPEYEAWQAAMAHDVAGHYLALLEELAARHAAEGDHGAAIRYARQYLAVDDLAETMHRRLIAAYVASGDRAAAARQYEQCTLILERELGVSPLPETRAALQPPPSPPPPSVSLAVLPTLDLPFTGREEALARLQEAVDRFRHGGLVLVHGEPGMGKSRLVLEFAARQPGLVLAGSSYTGSHALPYHPLSDALRATLRWPDLWESVPAPWPSELLPLLPDLHGLFPSLPAPLPAIPGQAQARLFTALVHTLRAFAARMPVLLCLDDLQWADEATLAWLGFLAGQPEPVPLAILATTHNADAPALGPPRQAFARAGRLARLELPGLTVAAVGSLLDRLLPDRTPEQLAGTATRLHATTAGNPFFILELLRELQETGRLADPPGNLPLPLTVRETVRNRLDHLSPIARQILEAAAVLDPNLNEALLQQAAARTAAETADALDELLAHRLLQSAIGTPKSDIPEFPHALLQAVVYQDLTPWRRKLLHRRAAEALAQFRPDDAATIAFHFAKAGEWESAVIQYGQAGARAAQAYAYDTALELVERAFALLPHIARPEAHRLPLLRQRLVLRRVLVQLPGWQADVEELLRLAEAAQDDEARLEALEARITLQVLQSEFARIDETATQALALARQAGNRVAEARVRRTWGWHLADALGRSQEGLAHLETARQLAREAGDAGALYQTLCSLAFVQRAEGRCGDARASASSALALARYRPGEPPHPACADALRELGEANAYLGRWEEARDQLRSLFAVYETLNDPWAYGALLFNTGVYSSNMGQHEEAISSFRRLVKLSESVGLPADSDYGLWHRAGLIRALLAAGQTAEAGDLLRNLEARNLAPGRPFLAWARATAEYHLAAEEPAAALAVLRPAVDWWRRNASLHDADVLVLLAQAALAAGDSALAETAIAEAAGILEPTDMRRYHLRLYWTRYRVTGNTADLAVAQAERERQAAFFTDPALRAAFLKTNV